LKQLSPRAIKFLTQEINEELDIFRDKYEMEQAALKRAYDAEMEKE